MKKKILLLLAFIFYGIISIQAQDLVDITNTGSCEKALDITRFKRFGPTTPPEKQKQVNQNSFELPKHTVWYKFTIQKKGIMLFDIIPTSVDDNYDFMLFKNTENFCTEFNNNNIKPLRTNYMPPQKGDNAYTGLSFFGKEKTYEKAIEVEKGQVYYLVLNNVYDSGKGHSIVFNYLKTIDIKGNISNTRNDHSINAYVVWRNLRNNEVFTKQQTNKKGDFIIKAITTNEANSFPQYELCVYADNFFPEYKIYTTEQMNSESIAPVNITLEKIKKGYNNKALGIIYFEPNGLATTNKSEYVKRRLLKAMLTNSKIEIILEGHTNGMYPSTDVDFQLSLERADVVKQYLITNGIDAARIQTKGLGSTSEIYQAPEDEQQEGANRRVEVNFVKF